MVITVLAALGFSTASPAFAQRVAKADAQSGVETFNSAMIKATRAMDNAALLALWEDDGVALLPSTPPIVGKVALTKFYTEHQVVDLGPGKQPFDGKGTMLFVLHRGHDGVWRLKREMWNPA